MSNLSDIGFPVRNEHDVNEILMQVLGKAKEIRGPNGFYLKFSDISGAEIYLQGNFNGELIGFNPHFAGKSRRSVGLTKVIERDSSELDGGFHAWAAPSGEGVEISGEYPFVFDVPDFRINKINEFPVIRAIQLTAFASNDFEIFQSEAAFYASQDSEPKFSSNFFIPSGLFLPDEKMISIEPPRPIGIFAGEIKEFELKTNHHTSEKFYWFLVETLGGDIDVAADPKLISAEPKIGGFVRGQFWLSGRLIA